MTAFQKVKLNTVRYEKFQVLKSSLFHSAIDHKGRKL